MPGFRAMMEYIDHRSSKIIEVVPAYRLSWGKADLDRGPEKKGRIVQKLKKKRR